ncbi:MAG: PEP-CTERM sorting domain-containing protein [Phycisphaeraceae bacterium]|nr:PEP-CTERM sorting domain-containing protein [Phycisphaeraceae bacterium]
MAAVVLFAAPGISRASLIGPPQSPTITISIEGVSSQFQSTPALNQFANRGGNRRELTTPIAFQGVLENQADVVIEQLEFDPDPFVVNNILITNLTGSTQVYTVGIALPTAFAAPNLISGNITSSVIDSGGVPGATLASVAGFSIYSAQIDFATVATLQDHPFTLIAASGGSNSSPASFGPNVNAIAVTSNIGIQLRFSITAGDTASILSRFDVVDIPEPASMMLLGLGALALVRRRH